MFNDEYRRKPNPFQERGVADALTALRMTQDDMAAIIITNLLDEHQQRLIYREYHAQRRSVIMYLSKSK